MDNKRIVTAQNVSVGADNEQSHSVPKHSNSIIDNTGARNLQPLGLQWVKIWRRYQWMNFTIQSTLLRNL